MTKTATLKKPDTKTTKHSKPAVLSASSLIGNPVRNRLGEDLGKVEELMVDTEFNRIGYAVISFGGLFGIGEKLFAVPWEALQLDFDDHCCYLDLPREILKDAPGFDKDDWPSFTDRSLGSQIYDFYGVSAYWMTPAKKTL